MAGITIKRLCTEDPDFNQQLDHLLAYDQQQDSEIYKRVEDIIDSVRKDGDEALLQLTRRYDNFDPGHVDNLELTSKALQQAWATLDRPVAEALQFAADRIREYAGHQKQASWQYTDPYGNLLGQQVTPLDRVGIYVPGGKAAYPSSVLMNAIPAKVAGVEEIIMVVPTPGGETNQLVLAAACLAGVDRVFRIGGAQAVAALAYGTASVPRVDKIVGPGNIYVATAKRLVFGQVGIDMIAGPSEILVIADGQTHPDWIAMDLFSQAEHDEMAQSILISTEESYLTAVEESIARLLPDMERADVIKASLEGRGAFILARNLDDAVDVANRIAPEHLELSIADPQSLVRRIRNAGAVFLGTHTAEAMGDYCAGPNHVLPTSGTARFSSPLGVYDFQKRTSLIQCSTEGARILGGVASRLAHGEGLTAHARSAEYRVESQ